MPRPVDCRNHAGQRSDLSPEAETRRALLRIWDAMQQCVRRGISSRNEILPGPLKVKRRAPSLFVELSARRRGGHQDDLDGMDWLNLYAMAVSEENAAGGTLSSPHRPTARPASSRPSCTTTCVPV
jgi:L-serine ammonia-lyase (EC 4.3.1.17)